MKFSILHIKYRPHRSIYPYINLCSSSSTQTYNNMMCIEIKTPAAVFCCCVVILSIVCDQNMLRDGTSRSCCFFFVVLYSIHIVLYIFYVYFNIFISYISFSCSYSRIKKIIIIRSCSQYKCTKPFYFTYSEKYFAAAVDVVYIGKKNSDLTSNMNAASINMSLNKKNYIMCVEK